MLSSVMQQPGIVPLQKPQGFPELRHRSVVMAARSEHEYVGSQPANIDELIRAFEGADED